MDILDKPNDKIEYYKYRSPVNKKDMLPEDQRKRLTKLVGLCMNKYITVNEYYTELSKFWKDNEEEEFAEEILLLIKN
mgnify:CR=1 FL=1